MERGDAGAVVSLLREGAHADQHLDADGLTGLRLAAQVGGPSPKATRDAIVLRHRVPSSHNARR